uniref:RING-type domain-containing protein n=1 Tax=Macrostomum lignano TaxID=282301 RepID=A0A1I8HVN1_9PLAT
MHRVVKMRLSQLNPHITCPLCAGYYIDATTIVECLHSFCRSCLLRHLAGSKCCPVCDILLHKTDPRKAIKADRSLQSLVYKLVPGLFKAEMTRRREFYQANPSRDLSLGPEGRGELAHPGDVVDETETLSVSLELVDPGGRLATTGEHRELRSDFVDLKRPCYLLTPACLTVGHLCTFIRLKLGLSPSQSVSIFYTDDCLSADYSVMDIAYVYSWRRRGPLRLFYAIVDKSRAQQPPPPPGFEGRLSTNKLAADQLSIGSSEAMDDDTSATESGSESDEDSGAGSC